MLVFVCVCVGGTVLGCWCMEGGEGGSGVAGRGVHIGPEANVPNARQREVNNH